MILRRIAFFSGLSVISVLGFIRPAFASQAWCSIQYINTEDATLNSVAVSLGDVNYSSSLCLSAATSLSMFSDTNNKFLGASGQSVFSGTDPTTFYINNT